MIKRTLRAAFTLIELLVVISIIAILAGIAAPALRGAMVNGQMAAAMNKARQVGLALLMRAQDYEGALPSDKNDYGEPISTSNDAFRGLIPAYLDNESIFAVGGSKTGARADNRISPEGSILERGENHWAYVAGLSTTSNSSYPMIVDHTDGSGYYSDKDNTFGGTWKGSKAVVVRVDTSASTPRLLGTGSKRYLPRTDEQGKNALQTDYMGEGVKLLEPMR